jgi:hypothetical protein
VIEIQTNIDEAVEQVEWRELWSIATMIRRQGERSEPQGPPASTYLAMAMAAPVDRGAQRPMVTGADLSALPGPGWCHDPTGQEPPLNYSVDEVPPNCGGAGGTIAVVGENRADEPLRGVETSVEVSGGAKERSSGGE